MSNKKVRSEANGTYVAYTTVVPGPRHAPIAGPQQNSQTTNYYCTYAFRFIWANKKPTKSELVHINSPDEPVKLGLLKALYASLDTVCLPSMQSLITGLTANIANIRMRFGAPHAGRTDVRSGHRESRTNATHE